MRVKISDKLNDKFQKAINRYGEGEVDWDIIPIVQPPNPPFYLVSLIMASPILGQSIYGGVVIQEAHNVSQDQINEVVRQGIEALKEGRTKALIEGANTPVPSMTGDESSIPVTPSGLLTP